MHHCTCVTHVSWCMPELLTSGFLWNRWRGKRSRPSRRMCNPQFYVSDKRPMLINGYGLGKCMMQLQAANDVHNLATLFACWISSEILHVGGFVFLHVIPTPYECHVDIRHPLNFEYMYHGCFNVNCKTLFTAKIVHRSWFKSKNSPKFYKVHRANNTW